MPFPPKSQAGGEDNAEGVGHEVEPLAAAPSAGAVSLKNLDEAAHGDGGENRPERQTDGTDRLVRTEIFPPDGTAGDEIHHHVGPFVDKTDIIQGCLGCLEKEAAVPDGKDAEDRERVVLGIEKHLYYARIIFISLLKKNRRNLINRIENEPGNGRSDASEFEADNLSDHRWHRYAANSGGEPAGHRFNETYGFFVEGWVRRFLYFYRREAAVRFDYELHNHPTFDTFFPSNGGIPQILSQIVLQLCHLPRG